MIDILKIAKHADTARDNIKRLTGIDADISVHLEHDSVHVTAKWVNYACQRTFSIKTTSMFNGGEIDYVWEQFEHLTRDVVVSKRVVEYHDPDTCNNCGERTNDCNGSLLYDDEFPTTCRSCGHNDHWAHGVFESSEDGLDACAKYTTTRTS